MRTNLVLGLLLTLPAAAASQDIEFAVPASFEGTVQIQGLSRLLLVIPPDGGRFALTLEDAAGTATNWTYTVASSQQPTAGRQDVPVPNTESSTQVTGITGIQADGTEGASVYLEGDLRLSFQGLANLVRKHDGRGLDAFLGGSQREGDYVRLRTLPDREPYVLAEQGALENFTIEASHLTRIEWFGVHVTCTTANCPDGGGQATATVGLPLDWTLTRKTLSFIGLETAAASLHGGGQAAYLLASGSAPSMALAGDARLPLASTTSCDTCIRADDQTLAATGNITLREVHDLGDGRMKAGFTAQDAIVRLDEAPGLKMGPATIAAASGAAVAVVVVVWKVLAAALFSRHVSDPLHNARRALLYRVVVANPGATFRQVAAKAGLAPGVARHHLSVLERNGLIVQRQHNSTLRFFENHGKYDADWQTHAVFSDPDLRTLHGWLKPRQAATQGEIVGEMKDRHGWSRSATQRLLAKLVEAKLAVAERRGRTLLYSATQRIAR